MHLLAASSSSDAWVGYVVFFWILCAIAGGIIGAKKGRGLAGTLLGLFLGIFGVIIAFVLSPSPRHAALAADQAARAVGAPTASERDYQEQMRKWSIAEAIRRDPTLGTSNDPGTLERLGSSAEAIQREAELQRLRDEALGGQ